MSTIEGGHQHRTLKIQAPNLKLTYVGLSAGKARPRSVAAAGSVVAVDATEGTAGAGTDSTGITCITCWGPGIGMAAHKKGEEESRVVGCKSELQWLAGGKGGTMKMGDT